MNASTRTTTLLTRPAMRFLLNHQRGTLGALDCQTGQPVSGNVHYDIDPQGRMIGYLTSGQAVLDAINAGAAISLTVEDHQSVVVGDLIDETGMPTEHAITRVQALIDAQVIDLRELRIGRQTQPLAIIVFSIYDLEVDYRE